MLDEVFLAGLLALTTVFLIGTAGISVANDGATAAQAAQLDSDERRKEAA